MGNSTELKALQSWFQQECNGDWEHQYGIQIGTLDNPGWSLDIELSDTYLADRPLQPISIDRADDDWVRCKIEDRVFKGRGGPGNLQELIGFFVGWATG